nr:olfactory receptor 25 [Gregopimpla kuwanae]
MVSTELQPDKDIEWAIGVNSWSLKVCGIWRSENNSNWLNAFSNFLVPFYVLIIIIFGLFPQTFALFRVWGDLTLMVENLITYLPFVVTLCKIVTMWYKKEVIITMMNFVREDWRKLKSKKEREVMIKYAHASRMITFGGYLVIVATVLVYHPPVIFGVVLRTLSNITDTGNRPLVLQTIYLFDVYKTPIYELTVITQAMSCSLAGFCYTTVGALFGVIVLHVCSQLENLTFRLEEMLKNDKEQMNFRKLFSLTVKEHQRLIRFVDMIENTFSIMLLMIVPAFTITFCVQGFQLINTLGDDVKRPMVQVVFCVVYMSFIAFVMFVYSSVGQALATQSEEIQYAAYNCEWYNLRPKEAAQLILILIRAQRPLQITAGKFVPLTMSTFATLLKTTAGYLSCLLAVHE